VGPVFDLDRFEIESATLATYAIASGYVLEDDPYLYSGGAGASLSKTFGLRTTLIVTGEYRHEWFQDSVDRPTSSDRSGDRIYSSVSGQYLLTPDILVTGALTGEVRDADADYLSYQELGVALGIALRIAPPIGEQSWRIAFRGGYAHRRFDAPDPTFSLSDVQKDDETFVEASLTVPLNEDWEMLTSLSYRNVDSNYDLYRYDNLGAALAVTRKF
jgi:hypothetical protein